MTTVINASTSGLFTTADGSSTIAFRTGGNPGLTINSAQLVTLNTTGAVTIPAGTTAQRPDPATNGMIRYNTDDQQIEGYINDAWVAL